MTRWICTLLSLAVVVACDSRPGPAPAGAGLIDAEKRAIFEKAEANSEKNSKVTRRPRRFYGDSL